MTFANCWRKWWADLSMFNATQRSTSSSRSNALSSLRGSFSSKRRSSCMQRVFAMLSDNVYIAKRRYPMGQRYRVFITAPLSSSLIKSNIIFRGFPTSNSNWIKPPPPGPLVSSPGHKYSSPNGANRHAMKSKPSTSERRKIERFVNISRL